MKIILQLLSYLFKKMDLNVWTVFFIYINIEIEELINEYIIYWIILIYFWHPNSTLEEKPPSNNDEQVIVLHQYNNKPCKAPEIMKEQSVLMIAIWFCLVKIRLICKGNCNQRRCLCYHDYVIFERIGYKMYKGNFRW